MKEIYIVTSIDNVFEPQWNGKAVAKVALAIDDWLAIQGIKIIHMKSGGYEVHFPLQLRAGKDEKYYAIFNDEFTAILEDKIIRNYLKMMGEKNDSSKK